MRNENVWRTVTVLMLAFGVPACHDDDDGDGAAGGGAAAPSRTVNAVLTGRQVSPPVETGGRGTATVTVAPDGESITYDLETSDLRNITAAHLHAGLPGADGPILFTLTPALLAGPFPNTLTAADLQPGGGIATFADAAAAILEGRTYVEVRTRTHPEGEVRGHLGPARFQAALSGSQEVPPNASPAAGTSVVLMNAEQTELAYTLEFSGLSSAAVAAHIHVGPPGENGPIIFTLATAPFGSPVVGLLTPANLEPQPDRGVVTFADAVEAILSGNAYVNVHSNTLPGGEIRGQLGP